MNHSQPVPEIRPGRPEAAAAIWRWRAEPVKAHVEPAGRARLRGLVQALVGGAAGTAMFFFWHRGPAYVVWAIAAVIGLSALVSPTGLFARIEGLAARLGQLVGFIGRWVLLAPFFIVVFAVFGRLFFQGKRDPLKRSFDRDASSYWRRRNDPERELSFYQKSF